MSAPRPLPGASALGGAAAAALVAAMAAAQAPLDRLVTHDGTELSGRLEGLSASGALRLRTEDGDLAELPLERVHSIELAPARSSEPEATAAPVRLWLRSGLALPTRLERVTEGGAVFSTPLAQNEFELPWRFVRAVVLADGVEALDPGFLGRLAAPAADLDTLYARGEGDELRRLSLRIHRIEAERVAVQFGGVERTLPRARVYGVVFGDASGAPPDRHPNPRVMATVAGHELEGVLSGLDERDCRLRLDEGVELVLPRDKVEALRVRTDAVVDLTELEPKVQQTPAFDRVWPWYRNRAPSGGPIRMGGKTYRRGIVAVPRTVLTYVLDGSFDVFEAEIGMAEGAGPQAHAVFRVLGDGATLFESRNVTPATAPHAIRVPVRGVAELALEVDFGEAFDLGDLCVFASPRIRKL